MDGEHTIRRAPHGVLQRGEFPLPVAEGGMVGERQHAVVAFAVVDLPQGEGQERKGAIRARGR